jgi:heme-degrading monooxygenase HmoA
MIARVWDGVTAAKDGEAYAEYVQTTGVTALAATEGNRGVYLFRRTEEGRAHFRVLSLWDSMEGIRRFAGPEPQKARYYPEDERYLLALDPHVSHYEVVAAASGEAARLADELRRIWGGDAWHGPSLTELLDGVTAAHAAARPIPGGHSIWELVLHDTAWTNVFRARLEGTAAEEPQEGDFPVPAQPEAPAWKEAQARHRAAHERLAAVVAGLSAQALEAKVPGRDFSARFQVHAAIRHTVYHSGQIGLLKKAAPAAGASSGM